MKAKRLILILLAFFFAADAPVPAQTVGTAFTYQGRLMDSQTGAEGLYDLNFTLYDGPASTNTMVGEPVTNSAVGVSNGLFSVSLDFGAVFGGTPLWLEIRVRTNGAAEFNTLSPRQALTPAPYALFAPNAGSAATLSSLLPAEQIAGTVAAMNLPTNLAYLSQDGVLAGNGVGLSNLHGANILPGTIEFSRFQSSTNGNLVISNLANPQGGWLVVSNGSVYLPVCTANGNFPPGYDTAPSIGSGCIWFMQKNTAPNQLNRIGSHIMNLGWMGEGGIQYAAPTHWFEEGWYQGGPGSIVLGNDGKTGGTVDIRYDGWQSFAHAGTPNAIKLTNSCTPSKLLRFRSLIMNTAGTTIEAQPAIWGRAGGTNIYSDIYHGFYGGSTLGELWFLTASPKQDNPSTNRWGWDTNTMRIGGIMMTNGWNLRGRLVQERKMVAVPGPNYVLDFRQIPHALEIRLEGDVAFTSTNWTIGDSVMDNQLIFLRSGGASRTLSFPAAWRVSSESGSAVLPTSLAAYTGMRIRLESLGGGENNVIAHFETFSDAPAADADADDFFSRSSLTPDTTQQRAIYQLCADLKMSGLWEKIDAIYPFVGTQENQRYNLKSASYTITWTGLTEGCFDANGVTGNGTGYGDTGFNPSTAGGQYRLDSAFIACYVGDEVPEDGVFVGTFTTNSSVMLRKLNATDLQSRGPTSSQILYHIGFTTDWRGLLSLYRYSFYICVALNGSEPLMITSSSTRLPDDTIPVLAGRWNWGVPSYLSTANLRALVIGGGGVTPQDMDTLLLIINSFQFNLGRKAI